MKWDAVVVGAGPAGATVAHELSKRGAKVLILEKKKLPRFKLCGGCLSARIANLLPEGWEKQVLNRIRGGILGWRGETFIERSADREVAYIVDRANFDRFLTEKALEEGAQLWEETEFMGFSEGKTLEIFTSRGNLKADFLIGADGFYTKVGRQLGYKKKIFFRSVELPAEGDIGDKVVIDIGLVSRGYAWVFPKGNLLNVGIASTGRENLGELIGGYIRNHSLVKPKVTGKPRGWMIPFCTKYEDLQLGRGRVLLVGDAANMVDPLLGEGIYYAVKGAKLLVKALERPADDFARVYRKLVVEDFYEELLFAGKIADLAYRFQRAAFLMGKEHVLKRFFHILSGGYSYKRAYITGLPEFLIELLRDLVTKTLKV